MSDIANSKFCRNCGAQVSRTDEFCPYCGEAITSKIFCQECGATNAQGQAFCENCGASLKNTAFASSKDTGADDGQTGFLGQEERIANTLKNEIPDFSQKSKKYQTKWQCSQCGAMNTERDNFCGNCGSWKSYKKVSEKQRESIPTSEPVLHEKENGTDSGTSSNNIKRIGILLGMIAACMILVFFALWKLDFIPSERVSDADEPVEEVSLQIPDQTSSQGDTPEEPATSALPIEAPEDNTPQEPVACMHTNIRKEEGPWEWEGVENSTACRGGTRIVKTFCVDCGDLLSEETEYRIDIEHDFGEDGVCVDCGFQEPGSEYLLPDSSQRYLEEEELAHLTHEELCFARNEIYARHGWIFSTKAIAEYFQSKSWYKGTTLPQNFDLSVLNQYETYNISLISSYEAEHFGGSYY